MNKIFTRWVLKELPLMPKTFTAEQLKQRIVDKHGTNYIEVNTSIGQWLTEHCIVVGEINGRQLYTRREY
jgi:hypothetical protein